MSDARSIGSADVDVDPDEIDRVLGAGDGDAGQTVGRARPGSRLWSRLMHRSPDPDLDDMDDLDDRMFFSRDYALRYAQRGVGKFTQVGGTALEDLFWAGVNFTGSLFRSSDAEPTRHGDATAIEVGSVDDVDEDKP